jgi:aspartate/methionine/tyrosine aminotransferase
MHYRRMPIEIESPEQIGYESIRYNLSESSYSDASFDDIAIGADLAGLLLCYGSHVGHEGLRRLLVRDSAVLRHEDVLLTAGAAGALFIIATVLLEKGDELLVVRPNYATNIETPRAIGASIKFIELEFDEGFALDLAKLRSAITEKTKYISVTYPHNPTGACLRDGEMRSLQAIAEEKNLWLLVDETYRDMVFGEQLPLAAEYSSKIISVSSVSKTYGLPGLRMGWIICRDSRLMEAFLAAKEQIQICGSTIDEELTFRCLQQKDRFLDRIRTDIKDKFTIVKNWMNGQDGFEWVEPKGGAVCFPRIRRPERVAIDHFYKILLEKYGVYTGPGHWFEMPRHYLRIGYAWPSAEELTQGLFALTKSLAESRR